MSDIEPPLITAEQIADEAKISMSMLFRLRAEWHVEPYRLGGKTGRKAFYTLDFRDRVLARKSGVQSVAHSASVLHSAYGEITL